MSKFEKLMLKVLSGNSDTNISFEDLVNLLSTLEFQLRIKGDHHILTRNDIEEIINLQPNNSKVKAYQVKQIRNLIVKYKLGGNLDV
jgi:hypothetical protein